MTQYKQTSEKPQRAYNGVYLIMAVPFLAVGGGTAYKLVSLIQEEGSFGEQTFFLGFALTFGSVGLLMLSAFLFGKKDSPTSSLPQANLGVTNGFRSPFPQANADKEFECSNQAAMHGLMICVVFIGLMSLPSIFAIRKWVEEDNIWQNPFVFVLPLLTIFLVLCVIRATIRWKKFGKSILKLKGGMGIVGGQLSGSLRTSVELQPTSEYLLKLTCKQTITTGSGKSRTTRSETRWEEEKKVPAQGCSSRSGIPVSFAIPSTCLETFATTSSGKVEWNLSIEAPLPGVNYTASFTIPVHKQSTIDRWDKEEPEEAEENEEELEN